MRITGETHWAWRALLDGEDVSDRCVWADDEAGEVEVLKRREDGAFYVDPDDRDRAASETRRGVVTLIPPAMGLH